MPKRDWLDTSPRFWRSPLAIAASAGAIGLVAGAMFAVVLARPLPSQSTDVAAATIPASPSVKQAETTGASSPPEAAPPAAAHAAASTTNEAEQASALGGCERQAWPYMTPQCQAERDAGQRKVRVITTDRLAAPVVNAIEAQSPPRARIEDKPVPQAAAAPAKAEAPAVAVEQPTPSVAKANTPEPVAASAAPETSAPVTVTLTPQQLRAEARVERRKAAQDARELRKREAKARKSLGDDEVEEDTRRLSSRGEPRRGRIVERWTEREYNVRSEDGLGRRTVVVRSGRDGLSYAPETETRRSNPLFSIFGN